jgi:hypothetical protein
VEGPGSFTTRSRERARERRARRRRRVLRWLGGFLVAGAVFFVGLAIGMAIESGREDDQGQTLVRTLLPTTVTPQRTVTITVSNP